MNNTVYGYDIKTGKIEINDLEMENVKWLFQATVNYTEHPPCVLVQEVIENIKEESGVEMGYEAEKKVPYSYIQRYIQEEIAIKNQYFNQYSVEHSAAELREILQSGEIDELRQRLNVDNL